MATEPVITINLNIDPTTLTAEEVGSYAASVYAKLTTELTTTGVTVTAGTPAHVVGLDKQLGRLTDHKATTSGPRVKALHAELVALGYIPRLPTSSKGTLPPYVSYIDPFTGNNLGNVNSETFTFTRGALKKVLASKPHMQAKGRYATCALLSDDAVKAVVKVAKSELSSPS